MILGLEREGGHVSRYETRVLPQDHVRAAANLEYAERLLKFLLWQKGGWRVYVGGPAAIGEYLAACYSPRGLRAFDYHFMGEDVYEKPFSVIACEPSAVPVEMEIGRPLGRHLNGCRIGFDLGSLRPQGVGRDRWRPCLLRRGGLGSEGPE